MTAGRVYLIGAGPGDPGLLTLRGKELLSRADVVVYDFLAAPRLLDYAPARAERIYVGKRAGSHTLSQAEINRLLVTRAQAGAAVARLKGGDPFVFGRGGEEALALVEAGIPFEVVPGVTSGIAAPAYAGIPVTHRQVSSGVGLITGHETPEKDGTSLDWRALANWKGTLSFYMGMANLGPLCEKLVAEGLDPKTPAAVIAWGATPAQKVVTAAVESLAAEAQSAGLAPPVMVVIGQVVALRDKLNWYERRPLFGRRIVVTREKGKASEFAALLEEQGAEVIELPAFRILPAADPAALREAVAQRETFAWIVFTSGHAVDAFFGALAEAGLDSRALARSRVAAIGPATAERLRNFGIRADLQPGTSSTADVVAALAAADALRGRRVLCPRSDIAPPELPDALRALGAVVAAPVAYRTAPDASGAAAVKDRIERGEVHWLTFASSSSARYFFAAIGTAAPGSGRARIASIGPATSATLRELGVSPDVEAEEHTTRASSGPSSGWKRPMTLLELADAMPARMERWCEKQERGLGRFGMGLFLAVLFLVLACIYVTPELHPVFSGIAYAHNSKNPFDWKTPGVLRSRLLTPLIGWAVGLRGELFIILPVLFGVAFLIAVYVGARSRFGWSPGESCVAAAAMAFSTPILSTLRFPGFVDTTTDLLILLAFFTTAGAGWAVFLGLALLNHEGAIVLAPWLAFLALGRRPSAARVAKVAALLLLACAPALLYHRFLLSHGLMPLSEGFYLRWSRIVGMLALTGEYLAFGLFEGFKLFWFFPIAALISFAAEKRYYELVGMCLLLGGALSQFLLLSDVSRLVGIAFPAVLIGMNECRRQLKHFRAWAWGIFCFNLLVPQFYVAQNDIVPLTPLPVKLLVQFCLVQLRPNFLPQM